MGIAFDNQGRLFVSSDSSGEIYVVVRDNGTNESYPRMDGSSGQVNESVRGRWMARLECVAFGVLMGLVIL